MAQETTKEKNGVRVTHRVHWHYVKMCPNETNGLVRGTREFDDDVAPTLHKRDPLNLEDPCTITHIDYVSRRHQTRHKGYHLLSPSCMAGVSSTKYPRPGLPEE